MHEVPSIRSAGARATGDVVISAARAESPALLQRAVDGSRAFSITKAGPDRVELHRRTNWHTWGETLIADFSPVDETHTRVTVRSRPTFLLQAYDQGQSRNDVTALLNAVSAVAGGMASPLAGDPAASAGPRLRDGFPRQGALALALVAALACILLGALLLAQH